MKGVVIKSTGSRYKVLTENNKTMECTIKGAFRMKGIKSTNPIAVGDMVFFETEKDGGGVINKIEERKNYIIRKSINLSKQSHILASNIDQALLIVTLAMPRTSVGFIDRFLVTSEAYHIPVKIIFNKNDLFLSEESKAALNQIVSIYKHVGYECVEISAFNIDDIETLKNICKHKTSLIAGHSGTGKSTLINAMDKNLNLKVGEISDAHNKGKHTTTFAEMHPLYFGGFIIDTPGIKELGLVDMQKEEVADLFPEMRKLKSNCKFNNCIHINEPKCAVLAAVQNNEISESRYISYLSIMNGEELNSPL